MAQSLFDGIRLLFDVNQFTGWTLVMLLVFATALVKIITESTWLATLYLPAMLFGALTANYLYTGSYLNFLNDKEANVVLALGIGLICGMALMLALTRLYYFISEKRTNHKRQLAAPASGG